MHLVTRVFSKFRQFLPCIVAAAVGIAVTVSCRRRDVQRETKRCRASIPCARRKSFHGRAKRPQRICEQARSGARAVRQFRRAGHRATSSRPSRGRCFSKMPPSPRCRGCRGCSIPNAPSTSAQGVLEGLPDYHIKDIDCRRQDDAWRRSAASIIRYSMQRCRRRPRSTASICAPKPPTWPNWSSARDADRLGFSPVRTLVSTGGNQGGFLFSLPIYKRGSPHDTIEDRRRNLVGFVHGSLITAKMIERIITENKTPKGLDLFFFAPGGGPRSHAVLCASVAASHLAARADVARRGR